jgi:hypothetical protein
MGFFSLPLTTWAQTLRLQVIPEEMRGRTFALLRTLMQGTVPLAGIYALILLSALLGGIPGLACLQPEQISLWLRKQERG